ncbi:MAG: hypothetical protein ABI379_10515 [Rhodanobacter sp.]
MRVSGAAGSLLPSAIELVLANALLLVNGISLVFDAIDSRRWLKGATQRTRKCGEIHWTANITQFAPPLIVDTH